MKQVPTLQVLALKALPLHLTPPSHLLPNFVTTDGQVDILKCIPVWRKATRIQAEKDRIRNGFDEMIGFKSASQRRLITDRTLDLAEESLMEYATDLARFRYHRLVCNATNELATQLTLGNYNRENKAFRLVTDPSYYKAHVIYSLSSITESSDREKCAKKWSQTVWPGASATNYVEMDHSRCDKKPGHFQLYLGGELKSSLHIIPRKLSRSTLCRCAWDIKPEHEMQVDNYIAACRKVVPIIAPGMKYCDVTFPASICRYDDTDTVKRDGVVNTWNSMNGIQENLGKSGLFKEYDILLIIRGIPCDLTLLHEMFDDSGKMTRNSCTFPLLASDPEFETRRIIFFTLVFMATRILCSSSKKHDIFQSSSPHRQEIRLGEMGAQLCTLLAVWSPDRCLGKVVVTKSSMITHIENMLREYNKSQWAIHIRSWLSHLNSDDRILGDPDDLKYNRNHLDHLFLRRLWIMDSLELITEDPTSDYNEGETGEVYFTKNYLRQSFNKCIDRIEEFV